MVNAEHNIESEGSAAPLAELSVFDRFPGVGQSSRITNIEGRSAAGVASLNNLHTADLYAALTLTLPGQRAKSESDSTSPAASVPTDSRSTKSKDDHAQKPTKKIGNVITRSALDHSGSYRSHHGGKQPSESYDEVYISKEHYTLTIKTDANGNTISTGSDGFRKVTDKAGNYIADNPPTNSNSHETYDKSSGVKTTQYDDGSVVKYFEKDEHTEAIAPDGVKTTKFANGGVRIESKDGQGRDVGSYRLPDGKGGYIERGWGAQPKDNYYETYVANTGATTRTEALGTSTEKTTTSLPDGTTMVQSKDGSNYQRNPDGSEHHWGKENYDKPPYDYTNDAQLNQSRETLKYAVLKHIPSDKQAAFKNNMSAFEMRARKEHLSPDEITKSYNQMSKLLDTSKETAVVAGKDRSLLAEGLVHQIAHPKDTNQGKYQTCNVTTVLKETLAKNPSVAAEMAATTAISGGWRAADGHAVKIDSESLRPQGDSILQHRQSWDRTYATQILNLVMVNDALQRRADPLTYRQTKPNDAVANDTGERRVDAQNKVVQAKQYDAQSKTWKLLPDASPGLSNWEVAALSQRLNGESHLISVSDPESGVDGVSKQPELFDKLQQMKDQRKFPVTITVDGYHAPIQDAAKESPGFGPHFVNIDAFDSETGRVHVSNQWGKASNRWVPLKHLFENANGDIAGSRDGVNTSEYQ